MTVYKYISRTALMWGLFISLLISGCLLTAGTATWQTRIFEIALYSTKQWQKNLGFFICTLAVLGFFALEAGSKGLSWMYVFCTMALTLVLFVHAYIDFTDESHLLSKTRDLLETSYNNYRKERMHTDRIDNFQQRLRCCGYQSMEEPEVHKGNHLVKSCCHWKAKKCIEEVAYNVTCHKMAEHVIYLSRLCGFLGCVAGTTQLGVLLVLVCGGIKYIYLQVFPPGGPIIFD